MILFRFDWLQEYEVDAVVADLPGLISLPKEEECDTYQHTCN